MLALLKCGAVLAFVAVFLNGFPAFTHAQEQPNPCAVPDALLQAGETQAARRHYVKLIEQDPSLVCAFEGLRAANVSPAPQPTQEPSSCSEADQKFDAGNLPAARAAYEMIGPEVKCAETGLAAVRDVERLCRQGDSLAAVGRDEDALTAYKAALEKNPEAGCAQEGVTDTSWGRFSRTLSRIAAAIPTILLVFFLLLLAAFIVLMLGWFKRVYARFASFPYVRAIIRPRLSFSPIDEDAATGVKVAASLLARVQERLQRFREATSSGSAPVVAADDDLDFGTPDEDFADLVSGTLAVQKSLESLGGLSEHGKLVAGVVNLLYSWLPIKRLALSGVLGPASLNQATMSISLEKDARLIAATILVGPKLGGNPDATDYLQLSERAVQWTQYVVAQALDGRIPKPRFAEAYVLASRALDLQLLGGAENLRQARDLYRAALRLNEENWSARVNLAIVESTLAPNYQERIRPLEEVRTEIETS